MRTYRAPPSDVECLEILALWNREKSVAAIIKQFNRSSRTIKSVLRSLGVPIDEHLERINRANYQARLANAEARAADTDNRPKAEQLFEKAWAEHYPGRRYEDDPEQAFQSRCAQPRFIAPAAFSAFTLAGVAHYGER